MNVRKGDLMRRWLRIAAIAALLISATAHTAPASMASGTIYFPPFEKGIGIASTKFKAPCKTLPSPVAKLAPTPITGRIDASAGLAVRGCKFAAVGETQYVPLGEVPEGFVGKKAEVVSVLAIDNFRFESSGSGIRTTHVGFTVGRKFAPTQRLMGYECGRSGCKESSPQNVNKTTTITISRTIESLPDWLWATVSVGAEARGSTGTIGSEFRATLVSVAVRWLA